GRHNRVYTPPREILNAIPGFQTAEMTRCKERGFCCGAGGARMWMEEKIGKRINVERTDEALATDADLISTACPFCIVMLSDAVTAKQQSGEAKEGVQVLDVSQILARSLAGAPKKEPAMAGGGHVATVELPERSITPDVTHESPKPVESTPAQTETADNVQLAQEEATPTVATDPGPEQTDPPATNQAAPTGPTQSQSSDPQPPTTESSDD
ncbi:MAG: hypothetical protein QOI82_2132, partial [Actinomycetota bacterium]|nr:hypothetical protein [Actinomycetota bacterium]